MMGSKDARKHQRDLVKTRVIVNDGYPFEGGELYDVSTGGAAVMYPDGATPTSTPLAVGQILFLEFPGLAKMPGRVARTFEGGFATAFDLSILSADR